MMLGGVSQLGGTCNPNTTPPNTAFTLATTPPARLTGPTTLTVNDPSQDYVVDFKIDPSDSTVAHTVTVSLLETATGTNTGGLFSWTDVVLPPGTTVGKATLHLACDTSGVFGADGPPFYPLCNVPRDPAGPCATRKGCSCITQDTNNPNDPNSHRGGTDALGAHPAQVEASIAVSPGIPGISPPILGGTNALSVMCQ